MTNKLDESIIFLNNLLIDKDDYGIERGDQEPAPLKESCIKIANKLKEYNRPINEQLLGLFCLCYREQLLSPESIDVSTINELIGEDMVDDIELFTLFSLDETGVRSLGSSQMLEEDKKMFMWWLFLAVNDVVFQNPFVAGFVSYILKLPNAPESVKDLDIYKRQFIQITVEQEEAHNRGMVQQFENMIEQLEKS